MLLFLGVGKPDLNSMFLVIVNYYLVVEVFDDLVTVITTFKASKADPTTSTVTISKDTG